jgi:chromosome segregation ATPase
MSNRSVGTPKPDDLPQQSDAYFAPALFQSLFWKPRFLIDAPVTAHLPLLFWLTAALRPRRVAVLGCNDGAAHFALCQALDKLNLDARCQGYGFWSNGPTPPPALLAHEGMLYDTLSQITAGLTLADALDRVGHGRTDLLFVDLAALPTGHQLTGETLMACLSVSGVLVLHGTRTLDAAGAETRNLARFLRASPHVEFPAEQGLIVMPRDAQMPAPLQSLIDTSIGGELRGDVDLVFRRSGQGLVSAARLAGRAEPPAQGDATLDTVRAELDIARGSAENDRARHQAETAEQTRIISELRQTLTTRDAELARLRADLTERTAQLAAVRAETDAATTTRDAALAKARAAEERVVQLTADLAAALQAKESERDTRFAETTELTRLAETLRAGLNEREEELGDVKADLSALGHELAGLKAELTDRTAALAALQIEAGAEAATRGALEARAQAAEARAAQLSTDLAAAMQSSQTERAERLAETADLTRRLDALRQRAEAPTPALLATAQASRDEAEALRGQAEDLRRDLVILSARLVELTSERDALRVEAQGLRAQIEALHNSTSWRVTAPMRQVKLRLSRTS